MAVEVILPRVDMDMAAGKISRWLHKDGDRVARGAALFEIETDKAAMEIDSPADGILRNIMVSAGASAPVGSAVAWIYAEGEAVAAPAPAAATAAASALPAAAPPPAAHVVSAPAITGEAPRATPLARRLARQAGLTLAALSGTGPRGRITAADVRGAGEANSAPAATAAPAPSAEDIRKLYAPGSF
ncbi:E3 binding domain-containing protein, partial [Aestuariivirga sp.]|uniref:E3 binding domain-containing protein n=1 Tax=Aestuariivirga sp. TaxID=2650926 RepID=UPI0025BBD58F